MKKFTLFLCIFIVFLLNQKLLSLDLELIENIEVGKKPMEVFYDSKNDLFHIFCFGIDNDYNGEGNPDLGDIYPSWWTLKINNGICTVNKVREFENGYFPFPLRPALVFNEGENASRIYIPFTNKVNENYEIIEYGRVCCYNLDDYSVIDDTSSVLNVPASALSYLDGKLYLSVRENNGNSVVKVLNISTNEFEKELSAGTNAQQTLPFLGIDNKLYLSILNEGSFGQSNSELQVLSLSDEVENKFFNIGDSGNHLSYNNNYLAVTVNGSHKVILYDIQEMSQKYVINTETSGYNGPRECHFFGNDYLLVSTYSNEIKIYDLNNNCSYYKSLTTHSNPEGMAVKDNKYLVTTNFIYSDYTADNFISVYYNKTSDIPNINNNKIIEVYPNPTKDYLFVNLKDLAINNEFDLNIYNSSGLLLYEEKNINNNQNDYIINLKNIGLSTGLYFLRIKSNSGICTANFLVIQ